MPESEKRRYLLEVIEHVEQPQDIITTKIGVKIEYYRGDRATLELFLTLYDLTFVLNPQKYNSYLKRVIFVRGYFRDGLLY